MRKIEVRAQATIWIILGVVLVASILLVLLIRIKPEVIIPNEGTQVFDAQSFLDKCTRQYVNEAAEIMIPQGGILNLRASVYFNNTNIEYLCYYKGYYDPCINQHPGYMQEIKNDIKSYIIPNIEICLDEMKEEFENYQSSIDIAEEGDINIDLSDDRVFVTIEREITITKQGETRTYDKFEVTVNNPIYNLASIAAEIASQEARFCYFEYVGYSIIYPRYEIRKFTMSDSSRIYTIKDKKSGEEMNIAIRGCAIPPGLSQ